MTQQPLDNHRHFKDNVTLAMVIGNIVYALVFLAVVALNTSSPAIEADPAKAALLLPAVVVYNLVLLVHANVDGTR